MSTTPVPLSQRPQTRLHRSRLANVSETALCIIPAVIAVGMGAFYHEFIGKAISANPILNYAILGAMAFGVGVIVWIVLYAQILRASAGRWLEASPDQRGLLRTSMVTGALRRMFDPRSSNTADAMLEAVENECKTVSANLEHRMELGAYLVGGMVALGLLGTFIGLLETLAQISQLVTGAMMGLNGGGAVDEAIRAMVGQLRGPLTAMATAFSASMFGIVGSVLLGLMLVLARRASAGFQESFRDDTQSHARHLIERYKLSDRNDLTVEALRDHMSQVVSTMQLQSVAFERAFDESTRTEQRISVAVDVLERLASFSAKVTPHMANISDIALGLYALAGATNTQVTTLQTLVKEAEVTNRELVVQGDRRSDEAQNLLDAVKAMQLQGRQSAEDLTSFFEIHLQEVLRSIAEQTDTQRSGFSSTIMTLKDSLEPITDISARLKGFETILVHRQTELSRQDEVGNEGQAKLLSSLQGLREMLANLMRGQDEGVRLELQRIGAQLMDLKALGTAESASMETMGNRAADAQSIAVRQTALLENIRTLLEAKKSDWVVRPRSQETEVDALV